MSVPFDSEHASDAPMKATRIRNQVIQKASDSDSQSSNLGMDGFGEHGYEVIFVPDADVQQVSLLYERFFL